MEKILDIARVGITTDYHNLPGWARTDILIGGPGFSVASEEFVWGDYIIRVEGIGSKGMSKADVDLLLDNAATINKQLNKREPV